MGGVPAADEGRTPRVNRVDEEKTMAEEPESRQHAAQLPEGDVIRILLEQHARIQELFGQVHNAAADSKRHIFGELRQLLAVHEAAEEMIVRPVTRAAAHGNRIASARNHEEHMAAHLLADLEKMNVSSPEFPAALAKFETNAAEHARREETGEFPLILKTRSEQQRAWMGKALRAAEALAPTHPHPVATGSTTAQYALGPFASLLDHARDAIKKARAS
jgi:hypothetical protein